MAGFRMPAGCDGLAVPTGAGACSICHGPVWPPGGSRCGPCSAWGHGGEAGPAGPAGADIVAPVALAVSGSRLAGDLWRYKAGPARERDAAAARLGALLACWLDRHQRCLLAAGGLAEPVAVVLPARSGGRHLWRLAAHAGFAASPDALVWRRGLGGGRAQLTAGGAWSASPVAGRDAVLLDDTWTTGRTAQAACAALRRRGARRVGVVVLGRHVSVGHPGGLAFLREHHAPWRCEHCCLCAAPAEAR